MQNNIPPQVPNSFRIVLEIDGSDNRLDSHLLKALREQNQNKELKNISRTAYKELFKSGKILIKGQRAKTSSSLARGTTYIDILID